MEQALTKLDDQVKGVYAPNDGLANAVITALTARKLNGKVLVTGQDATDAGLASILAGDQTMTVYKSIHTEATPAAKSRGRPGQGRLGGAAALTTTTVNNGTGHVPALLLDPVGSTRTPSPTCDQRQVRHASKLCSGAAKNACDF